MEDVAVLVLVALLGYLFGSFPTAYLLVKHVAGKNILELGTANVGTLNVHRATNSKLLTAATLAADVGKGVLALVIGYVIADVAGVDPEVGAATAGIAAVVGHNYTIFLKFQGGKGLATSLPVLFFLEPFLVAVWIGSFLVTAAATRLLVLGQIMGTVVTPIVALIFFRDSIVPLAILGVLVFIRHASRIPGVVKGTEPKMYYKIDKSRQA